MTLTVLGADRGSCADGMGPGGVPGIACPAGRCHLTTTDTGEALYGDLDLPGYRSPGAPPAGPDCTPDAQLHGIVVRTWGLFGLGAEAHVDHLTDGTPVLPTPTP